MGAMEKSSSMHRNNKQQEMKLWNESLFTETPEFATRNQYAKI